MSGSKSSFFLLIEIDTAYALAPCTPAAAPAAPISVTVAPTSTPEPAGPIPTSVSAQPAGTVGAQPTQTIVPVGASYPLTLEDDLGREVRIAARPAHIVSLAPSITESLFAIDAGAQMVALTEYCNYPPEAAQGREIVGGFSAQSLSVETIVSLKPDLVFAAGTSHRPVSEALKTAGVPVLN